ncbi:MAG: C39 family peptidase, partial [Anaerolineae bacterium]|nr:C39 family peptidase [Anaerolineae bacterium]
PFGVAVGESTAGLGYTGEWFDADVGLEYLRARWYQPGTGRFTSRDPLEGLLQRPDTQHRYTYAAANPVNFTDPRGLWYGPDQYDQSGAETLEEELAFSSMHYRLFCTTTPTGAQWATKCTLHLAEEVPLYSQLDNSGYWEPYTSCGPTTLAMALNCQQTGPTPQEIIDYAIREELYLPSDPAGIYTSPSNLYKIAQHYRNSLQGQVSAERESRALLRAALSLGLPVVVDVTVRIAREDRESGDLPPAHFVLVTGIDADNTVYVNDPYGEQRGGERREVSWENFNWAWQNNSDIAVGGQGWWMVASLSGGE